MAEAAFDAAGDNSKMDSTAASESSPETTSRASSSVSAYGRAALGRASRAIETAENGAQEHTLNRECFSIGTLVGAGEIDELTALEALTAASYRMPAYAEPWGELNEKVRRSVEQGMARPRIRIAAKRTELVDTILETDPLPPKPTNAPREKKEIVLRVGETERIVDEIETALIAARRGLYRRGGLIVATAFDEIQTWDGKTTRAQVIEERGEYALLEDIEAAADFFKFDKKKNRKRAQPPMALVRTLQQRRHRLRLPNLVGICSCPTIKANGELVTKPGYDPRTGILYDPLGMDFPQPPDRPARAQAEKALARIAKLFSTFAFVTQDDKAVALSLVLTTIARPALPFAPMHDFDAPVAGAGKSKLVDLASILATGHEAGVIAQGENREEFEKRLSMLLMRGDPIIAIDNCELPVEGELLNSALTQPRVTLRILGYSKGITVRSAASHHRHRQQPHRQGRPDPSHAYQPTRSEMRTAGAATIRLRPSRRRERDRGEIVAAVLTILRAYHVAGRPKRPPRLQSFAEWSDTVRGALMWLGAGDPVRTMERLRKADPVLGSIKVVMNAWRATFGSRTVTAREAVETANKDPALHDALMNVVGRRGVLDARSLGHWLTRTAADRVVNLSDNGREDYAFENAGELQGAVLWRAAPR